MVLTPFLGSIFLAIIAGIACFFVERTESIPIHIDSHRSPILAALTGGTATFFASFILIEISKLTM